MKQFPNDGEFGKWEVVPEVQRIEVQWILSEAIGTYENDIVLVSPTESYRKRNGILAI